jgi:hypothetical protein
VDGVEVAVMPVLLGGGIPLLAPPSDRVKLTLAGHKIYPSGIVSLEYGVTPGAAQAGAPAISARTARKARR